MNITVSQSELKRALGRVKVASSMRHQLPVLSSIHFSTEGGKLTLLASNLDLWVSETMDATVNEQGAALISALNLSSILADLNQPSVTIKSDGKRIGISAGPVNVSLPESNHAEFPQMKKESGVALNVQQADLLNALRFVERTILEDEKRHLLGGACFDVSENTLDIVAYGGPRFSRATIDLPQSLDHFSRIVPAQAVRAAAGLLGNSGEAKITLGESSAHFDFGETRICSPQVNGNFVDWRRVLTRLNLTKTIEVDKDELQSALKLSRVGFSEQKGPRARFSLSRDTLNISANDSGSFSMDIVTKYDGDKLEILGNPNYLLDMVNTFNCDRVPLCFEDNISPIAIKGSGFMGLIQPLMDV